MNVLERRLAKLEPALPPQSPPRRVLLGGPDDLEAMAREAAELEAHGFAVMQIHLVTPDRGVVNV